VNPDGVRFDQKTDSLWRKNRNTTSAVPGDDDSIGVDINRNYDFLWNFSLYFDPTINPASNDPYDQTFHGTEQFSEAESRNGAWVFEQFPNIRWYTDIHSIAGTMYYSWADDDDQIWDPSQNFLNPAWDGKRGILGRLDYREYISASNLFSVQLASYRVASAMNSVGGGTYGSAQAMSAGATSGTSMDYAFSRFQVDPSKNKVYGFTLEFGNHIHFYPTLAEFRRNVMDTGAGLMEFCLAAVDVGLV
jgi:hypothetical protein